MSITKAARRARALHGAFQVDLRRPSITLTGREHKLLPPVSVRLEAAAFIWYDYLTPDEARTIARALIEAADTAESAA